jgi:hypothetical protein
VIATPNLNGDYLSDAAAAQVGGLGMAPGGNIGDGLAVFEATHGTAPKYAGLDKVNPGSVILSGVMMLEYMGWDEAAKLIVAGIEKAIGARRSPTTSPARCPAPPRSRARASATRSSRRWARERPGRPLGTRPIRCRSRSRCTPAPSRSSRRRSSPSRSRPARRSPSARARRPAVDGAIGARLARATSAAGATRRCTWAAPSRASSACCSSAWARPRTARRAQARRRVAGRAAGKLGTGAVAFYAAGLDARGAEAALVGLDMAAFRYDDLKASRRGRARAPLERATIVAGEEAREALARPRRSAPATRSRAGSR